MSIFKIQNIEGGWITGFIEDESNHVDFDYSYLTDFLGDLVKAFVSVLNGEKEYVIVDTEIEPGKDYWKISYDDKVIIDIFLFNKHEDYFDTRDEISIEDINDYKFIFSKEEFINSFINEIESNLDKYNDNYSYNKPPFVKTEDFKKYIAQIKEIVSNR